MFRAALSIFSQYEAAEATLEKEPAAGSPYPQVDFFLGNIDAKKRLIDQAISHYQKSLTLHSAYLPARVALAEALRTPKCSIQTLQLNTCDDSIESLFEAIKVNPFTFEPQMGALQLTPLRAYAHQVPHYYLQNFGSATSHPHTNEYAAFAQDTSFVWIQAFIVDKGIVAAFQISDHKGLIAHFEGSVRTRNAELFAVVRR